MDDGPLLDPYSAALADAVDAVLAAWVERQVARLAEAHLGRVPPEVESAARDAGDACREELGGAMRELLAIDVDDQPINPLALLRMAVRYPTAVLVEAGVPPLRRDEFAERSFPDDVYGLTPATWADLDPSLQEPGLVWSAWKAKSVLDRRRSEGLR
jgi:hypothetical protein